MKRSISAVAIIALVALASAFAFFASHDLTGKWQLAVVTDNGTGYPIVNLKQTGDSINGTYESNAFGIRSVTGIVKGDSMYFVLSGAPGGESTMVLTYMAELVTADSMVGHVDFSGMGGAAFTGVRQK